MTPGEALDMAGQIEAETSYRNRLAREMYRAGYGAGYRTGYEAAWGEREAAADTWWREYGRDSGPGRAELERRRWGPGGREHFADPRPGDFPGRCPQPQPEPEAEATA